jgi:hypothetical protein
VCRSSLWALSMACSMASGMYVSSYSWFAMLVPRHKKEALLPLKEKIKSSVKSEW